MSKLDLSSIVSDVKKQFKDSPRMADKIGTGDNLTELKDSDFIIMPQWWKTITGAAGLPFNRIVMLAGQSDSGKTSTAIEAMKAAQKQEIGIIYVETEGKACRDDLYKWGVDPTGVMLIQSTIAEEAFELLFTMWDAFRAKYPNAPLLVIFDSIGNVISQRDADIDLTKQDSKPGGKGKINRLALSKMIAKCEHSKTAILLNSYSYDNIGSHGKTNAGGAALNFFSSLTFQTSRKGWYERTVNGEKVRAGAIVKWTCYKNHLDRSGLKKKDFTLRITSEGIQVDDSE